VVASLKISQNIIKNPSSIMKELLMKPLKDFKIFLLDFERSDTKQGCYIEAK
jgi:hypothetical protein